MIDFEAYERHIKGTTPFRDGYVVGRKMPGDGRSHADFRIAAGEDEQVMRVLAGEHTIDIARRYDAAENILKELSTAFERRRLDSWNGGDYLLIETVGCVGKHSVPQSSVAKIGVDVCRALERLDAAGTLHLSIKPDNICYNGERYGLTGFEYSCGLREASDYGRAIGTPQFFAPEVMNGEYNRTTDIYALCLTMYYLLNGNVLPFDTPDSGKEQQKQATITRFKGGEIVPLMAVDAELMRIILKGLSLSPDKRWQDPADMKNALIDYLEKKRRSVNEKEAARTAVNIVNNCAVFLNQFELIELIGAGTYGAVYRAYDRSARRECAVKLQPVPKSAQEAEEQLRLSGSRDRVAKHYESVLNEMVTEASISLQLSSCRNIVRTYLTGVAYADPKPGQPRPLGGCMWMSMELLDPLDKTIKHERYAVKIGIDICNALDYAHSRGIIHRDVKPDNIMFAPDIGYKLGDFGVAKIQSTDLSKTVIGTPKFMAPELLGPYLRHEREADYDESVDTYALGLSIYSMLNRGLPAFVPYDTQMLTNELYRRAQDAILRGDDLPDLPGVSKRLIKILRKACSKNPKDRFRTAKVMRDALADHLNTMMKQS